MRWLAPAVVLILALSSPAQSRTWHVLPDGTGDAPTIQAAIDSSSAADSILVAEGTYFENLTLLPHRSLAGSWDPTFTSWDVEGHPATVDGTFSGPCIFADFAGVQDDSGSINGFVLRNGTGHPIAWRTIGGGIYAKGVTRVSHCIVEDCTAGHGAGLAMEADSLSLDHLIVRNNTMDSSGNQAAGLYIDAAWATIDSCQIVENRSLAPEDGQLFGVGAHFRGGLVTVRNSIVSHNRHRTCSETYGVGIYAASELHLVNTSILHNGPLIYPGEELSDAGLYWTYGAGIYGTSALYLGHCQVSDNYALGIDEVAGAGIYHYGTVQLLNSEITRNTAHCLEGAWAEGAGLYGGSYILTSCTVSENTALAEGGRASGAGFYALNVVAQNSSFASNVAEGSTATEAGGLAAYLQGSQLVIAGNEVRGDQDGYGGAIGFRVAQAGTLSNCLFYRNVSDEPSSDSTLVGGLSGPVVGHHNLFSENSNLPHSPEALSPTNLYEPPLLASEDLHDLHLAVHSPGIDAGDPAVLDPDGSRSDIGIHGGPGAPMDQPVWVTGLTWAGTEGGTQLYWDENPEPDVTGYAVYRADSAGFSPGWPALRGLSPSNSFLDRTAYPLIPYAYRVSAFDESGYGGGYSVERVASSLPWQGIGDSAPPEACLVVRGTIPGGFLGASVASGDLNGDGVDDLIIGIPNLEPTTGFAVFFGTSTFSPESANDADAFLTIPSSAVDAGWVLAVGDFNGDGFDDLAAGAPGSSPQGRDEAGSVSVFSGRSDWTGSAPFLPDITVLGVSPGDRIGQALALGDVNADELDDLVIGAPKALSPAGNHDGKVLVVFGDPSLPSVVDLASMPHLAVLPDTVGLYSGDRLGSAVSVAEVTGDGIGDLILGARAEDPDGRSAAGSVHVLAGSPGLPALGHWDLAITPADLRIDGGSPEDQLGVAVTTVDIDSDGVSELVLGAWYAKRLNDGSPTGAVYVICCSDPDSTVVDLASEEAWLTAYGRESGELFGSTLPSARPGGPTFEGLVIGGREGLGGRGAAYVLWMPEALPAWIDAGLSNHDLELVGPSLGEDTPPLLASALAYGDFNADGRIDVVAGAYGTDSPGLTDAGAVIVAIDQNPTAVPPAPLPFTALSSSVWPNPSTGPVFFRVHSPTRVPATLAVFDVTGRAIWSSTSTVPAGSIDLHWNGQTRAGNPVAPGLYFLRVVLGPEKFQRKVVIVR